MKVQTINVIEYNDDNLIGITSFEDNEEGNKEAEYHFSKIAKENRAIEEDIDSLLDDGYYEQGNYQLFLAHSNGGKETSENEQSGQDRESYSDTQDRDSYTCPPKKN